jgi:Leu/Phe-tRNA-protein transferase
MTCFLKQFCVTLRYNNKDKRVTTSKNYHIKADWETLQIIMKCREQLSRPMAGLNIAFG